MLIGTLLSAYDMLIGHCIQHMTHANQNTAFIIWHMLIRTLHSAYDTCKSEHYSAHDTYSWTWTTELNFVASKKPTILVWIIGVFMLSG